MSVIDEAFEAVQCNDLKMLESLFKKYNKKYLDVDMSSIFDHYNSLLEEAIAANHCEIVAFLLLMGAKPIDISRIEGGRMTKRKILIETMLIPTIDVNQPFGYYLFAGGVPPPAIDALLQDPNNLRMHFWLENIKTNKTPLVWAIEQQYHYVVQYLLQIQRASPEIMMHRDSTLYNSPLQMAAGGVKHGPLLGDRMVQTLLQNGADPVTSQTVAKELREAYWQNFRGS